MKYIVADDHTSMRLVICELIKTQFGAPPEDVSQCDTSDELLKTAARSDLASALIVTDLLMPGRYKRLHLIRQLKRHAPYARIIVHTAWKSTQLAQELIFQAVDGYVFKTSPTIWLGWAISDVIRGDRFIDESLDTSKNLSLRWWELTMRESDVVVALCKGWSAATICTRYNMKKKTLSAHKRAAMVKLEISEEAGLAGYLYAHGLDYLLDD